MEAPKLAIGADFTAILLVEASFAQSTLAPLCRVQCAYAFSWTQWWWSEKGRQGASPGRHIGRIQVPQSNRRAAEERHYQAGRRRNRTRLDRVLRQEHAPAD